MKYLYLFTAITLCFALSGHAATWHVPDDAATIQAGIDLASSGDTVSIAPGIYSTCTHVAFDPVHNASRGVCFELKSSIVVIGETGDPADVVIDAEGSGGVVYSYQDDEAILQGLTIRGGSSTTVWNGSGGGIYCYQSDLTIRDCIVEANESPDHAGGAMFFLCSPIINHCIFRNNTAHTSGGGAFISTGAASLTDCTFESNIVTATSFGDGGGVYFDGMGSPSMARCVFINNSAPVKGGGINVNGGADLTMHNCQILQNHAELGGGICTEAFPATATIIDSSIHDNTGTSGGGVYISYSTSLMGSNVDFAGNAASEGIDGYIVDGGSAELSCCLTDQSYWHGTATIDNSACGSVANDHMNWGFVKGLYIK